LTVVDVDAMKSSELELALQARGLSKAGLKAEKASRLKDAIIDLRR